MPAFRVVAEQRSEGTAPSVTRRKPVSGDDAGLWRPGGKHPSITYGRNPDNIKRIAGERVNRAPHGIPADQAWRGTEPLAALGAVQRKVR